MARPGSLYWPTPCPGDREPGLIIGWASGCDDAFVVAGIVPAGEEYAVLSNVRRLCDAAGFRTLHTECGTVPCILGFWEPNAASASKAFDPVAGARLCAVHTGAVCAHPLLTVSSMPVVCEGAREQPLDAACLTTAQAQWTPHPHLAAVTLPKRKSAGRVDCLSGHADCAAGCTAEVSRGGGKPVKSSGTGKAAPPIGAEAAASGAGVAGGAMRPFVLAAHYPEFLTVETAGGGRVEAFLPAPAGRPWYVTMYRPPDPLKLELLSVQPCRVPGMHALGSTAVARLAEEGGSGGTGFQALLHQMNAASFVHRYVTGEIEIPRSALGVRPSPLPSPTSSASSSAAASASSSSSSTGAAGSGAPGRGGSRKRGSSAGSADAVGFRSGVSSPSGNSISSVNSSTSISSSGSATSSSASILEGAGVSSALAASVAVCRERAPLWRRAVRTAAVPVLAIFLALRMAAALCLRVLLLRAPRSLPLIGGASLYDASALARQLHLRALDYCEWPRALVTLRRMQWEIVTGRRWHSADALFAQTAAWHDTLWRFVADVLIGLAACLLLTRVPALVMAVLRAIHTFGQILHIDVLRAWIDWLMGLPAGLKLNHFAGRKIGGGVLSFITWWEYITTYLTPWEPVIVMAVGLVGLGGGSFLLAVTADVLELATVHLYTLYAQFAWLHSRQVRLLRSLWKLFRGKKQNVLRARVDSSDFDMAQLLLGTLLFTVLFFLFPTTSVYYAFFLSVYMGIQAVRGVIWWLTSVLNNIPPYALYCALRAPQRLPAGIYLSLLGSDVGGSDAAEAAAGAAGAGGIAPAAVTDGVSKRQSRRGAARVRIVSTLQKLRSSVPGQLELVDSDLEDDGDCGSDDGASSAALASNLQRRGPTLWFQLHTSCSGAGVALAPLGEVAGVVVKRFSFGTLLSIVLFGEPGLAALSTYDDAALGAPATGRGASNAVAATGLNFGIVNAAANAPVEAPAAGAARNAAASREGQPRAYRLRHKEAATVNGSWQQYWAQLSFLADAVIFGTDFSPAHTAFPA